MQMASSPKKRYQLTSLVADLKGGPRGRMARRRVAEDAGACAEADGSDENEP
jgi:hypothetical protein